MMVEALKANGAALIAFVQAQGPFKSLAYKGSLEPITFTNEEAAWSVVRVTVAGRKEPITAVGKGENFPIASNDSAAGRQSNRRVELIFTDGGERIAADPGR